MLLISISSSFAVKNEIHNDSTNLAHLVPRNATILSIWFFVAGVLHCIEGGKKFRQEVFDKIQLELNLFGFLLYNANMKQLVVTKVNVELA